MKFLYVSRKEWGAQYERGNVTTGAKPLVVIHHSWIPDVPMDASSRVESDAMRSMEREHVKTRGWKGIAYNWLVFQSGKIYEGRGWNRVGSHTEGQNSKSVGICFVVNGDAHGLDIRAWDAARRVIDEGVQFGAIATDYAIKGHRDYSTKTCPGAYIYPHLTSVLGSHPVLKLGTRGGPVLELQRLLGIHADGYYGPQTEIAVKKFQETHGLAPDGVVGAKTWKAIS